MFELLGEDKKIKEICTANQNRVSKYYTDF